MSEEKQPYRPHLVDILNGLTASYAFAELYGEQHPEHTKDIQEYLARLSMAKRDLVNALRPNVL